MGLLGKLARAAAKVFARAPEPPSPATRRPPAARAAVAPVTLPEPPPEPELEVEAPVPGSLLLDCREPGEYASGVAEGALLLPMDAVPHHLAELPRDRPITVYCAAGARSAGVAHWLREQGLAEAWSLAGGIGALRYGGGRVVQLEGRRPGTRVVVDGTRMRPPAAGRLDGEVVEDRGETVRVRVVDDFGYQVVTTVPADAVG